MQDPNQYPADAQQSQELDSYIGTPEEDALTWVGQQYYPDTCVVRSEEYILEMFTGLPVDEHALVQESMDNGWYVPGEGTDPKYVGNLLEDHGIPTTQYSNASTYDLANELAQGHKVIVAVDAGELWSAEQGGGEGPVIQKDEQGSGSGGQDHAVVVTGIDLTDPNNIKVLLNDPGTGEAAVSYPMDQFVAAWQDSNFSVTATNDPAPSSLPEMANFDYEAGHIPEVMGIPYEDFATLTPESPEWTSVVEEAQQTIVPGGTTEGPEGGESGGGGEAVLDGGYYTPDEEVQPQETPYDES